MQLPHTLIDMLRRTLYQGKPKLRAGPAGAV
jgi:hypothetical protein